ncbi:PREDICTED: cartilage intermediate layer protein 1-like [Branchiostoma belcheri]|uniref:Cartilage intermediate layer protein 1-like n=1 Tax=Branchiostoma belcheri TaxID=7741 RepID=A0A6P4Z507_BRABE|nr:PREDICTED: cartilage intermediate layer protein 1-like [Branchiostoma belcheri]
MAPAVSNVNGHETLSPAEVPQQARSSTGDQTENEVLRLVETLKNMIEEEDRAAESEWGGSVDEPVEEALEGVRQVSGGCPGWTDWYDRDDPSYSGDWEYLSSLHREKPGQICAKPSGIQARVKGTNTPASQTGQKFHFFDPQVGFVCRNEDQDGNNKCKDYEARFWCP